MTSLNVTSDRIESIALENRAMVAGDGGDGEKGHFD